MNERGAPAFRGKETISLPWLNGCISVRSDGVTALLFLLCVQLLLYISSMQCVCVELCMTDETGTEGGVSVCAKVRSAYRCERVWLDQSSRWT